MILRFSEWLAETPWSIALHESLYGYAIVESVHVWSLCGFLSMAVLVDVRLLGLALRDVPVSTVIRRILPWSKAGFVVMVITGALLFFAIPVRTYHSVFFRLKVILLVMAGANAWWFHLRTEPGVAAWDVGAVIPRRARLAGALSLAIWALVVIAGRMIAYNWFDCDRQPQPAMVNWAASCDVTASPE
ncbi:MAG: hypothetical protein HW394_1270 [Acidobacteria bacterium]|nr:hypothetical protein [Acidobacteriota bacterium]